MQNEMRGVEAGRCGAEEDEFEEAVSCEGNVSNIT